MSFKETGHQLHLITTDITTTMLPNASPNLKEVVKYKLLPIIRETAPLNKVYKEYIGFKITDEKSRERWFREKIGAFQALDSFAKSESEVDSTEQRGHAYEVCFALQDILRRLQKSQAVISHQEKTTGRPHKSKYELHQILWDMKMAELPANSLEDHLCRVMLDKDVKPNVDKKDWSDLYAILYGEQPRSDNEWRKIDSRVRDINQRVRSQGFDRDLLSFQGGRDGFVMRLL